MGEPAGKTEPTLEQALFELANAIRQQNGGPAADEWMTPEAAAEWLGIHVQTVLATVANENPPWAKKFGRVTRISRTLLLQSPPVERKKVRR